MKAPRVSVLVMIYNSARHLAECLESLLDQTLSDFEVLLVDDGSTDGSDAICRRYAAADSRFRVIRFADNRGLSRSRAETLPEAAGEYAAILDSDDLAAPVRLERQAALLDEDAETVLAAGFFRMIDGAGKKSAEICRAPLTDTEIRWHIAFGNCLAHSTVMFRKAEALACGGYSAAMLAGEDMDFYSRILTRGRAAVVPEVVGFWRSHGENKHKTEPPEYRDFYGIIVRHSIARHLGLEVSREVAEALVDSYITPAASLPVFREAIRIAAASPWLLRDHRGRQVPLSPALKRCALLGLLKLRRRNMGEPWWPEAAGDWRRALRELSRQDESYYWFADAALFRPKRQIAIKEMLPLAAALFAGGKRDGGIKR